MHLSAGYHGDGRSHRLEKFYEAFLPLLQAHLCEDSLRSYGCQRLKTQKQFRFRGKAQNRRDLADPAFEVRVIVELFRFYTVVFRQNLFEFSSEDTGTELLRTQDPQLE